MMLMMLATRMMKMNNKREPELIRTPSHMHIPRHGHNVRGVSCSMPRYIIKEGTNTHTIASNLNCQVIE